MRCSDTGRNLIRTFEGLCCSVYTCPAGKLTIGYGHTRHAKVFRDTGLIISIEQAEQLLSSDITSVEADIYHLVTAPLTQQQYDALVSFVFNVGSDIDDDNTAEGLGDSTLLKKLNRKDYIGAAAEFTRWNKGHVGGKVVVLPGLTRRREAEQKLFLKGTA